MSFLGSWLVTEYVFNADGSLAGLVHQKRMLHRLENENIRVTQVCEPDEQLNDHAMADFAGEWVFDLCVDGKNRHYLGEDVLGMGIQYVDGVMTGQGRWPRFGPEFVSFGFLDGADRQITGGLFHNNGAFVANIIGTAVLEDDGVTWPKIGFDSAEISPTPLSKAVGATTYQVWKTMLNEHTDNSLTAQLAAGMMQYASQAAGVHQIDLQPMDVEAKDLVDDDEIRQIALDHFEAWQQLPWE